MLVQLESTVGFSLRAAVAAKYAKNLERTWKEPDRRGVVEHVKDYSEKELEPRNEDTPPYEKLMGILDGD